MLPEPIPRRRTRRPYDVLTQTALSDTLAMALSLVKSLSAYSSCLTSSIVNALDAFRCFRVPCAIAAAKTMFCAAFSRSKNTRMKYHQTSSSVDHLGGRQNNPFVQLNNETIA